MPKAERDQLLAFDSTCYWKPGGTEYYENTARKWSLGPDTLWVLQVHHSGAASAYFTEVAVHVYTSRKGQWQKQLAFTSSRPDFVRDTVLDANFDGQPDYIAQYYSGVGCCPRDAQSIYLNKGGQLNSTAVEVFNPCYDAEHQTILEMSYGRPPWIELSKSVWREEALLKVESVGYVWPLEETPDRDWEGGPFVIYNHLSDSETEVDRVPAPYRCLEYFNYFTALE